MAEQQTEYEFVAVDSKDILAERQEDWRRFIQLATASVVVTAVVLVLMAIFLI